MATETRNLGLLSIEVGSIAADGDVASLFEALGVTYKDTAEITQEEGEKIEHFCEESDDAIESFVSKGKTTIKWSIVDFTPETLQKIFGGNVSDGKWEAPDSAPAIEMSVKVTPKSGKAFVFPRCSVSAIMNYKLAKSGIAQAAVTATVLQPVKAGVASIIYG